MNCRDFEALWNERLDRRGAVASDADAALDAHAAVCPACRAKAARFQLLGQALACLTPVEAPADLTERCLWAVQTRPAARSGSAPWLRRLAVPLAAAACLAVVARFVWPPARPAPAPDVVTQPDREADSLPDALADATAATWELALDASAPAARIGRDVLDATVDSELADGALPSPSVGGTASEVLNEVGERVNAGVRPLSGSARHAFGFLLGPALNEPPGTARPS